MGSVSRSARAFSLAVIVIAAGCSNDANIEPPPPASESPVVTGVSASIDMEPSEILYRESWNGPPDVDAISAALFANNATALVPAENAHEIEQITVEISRESSTGGTVTEVSVTSGVAGSMSVTSEAGGDMKAADLCERGEQSAWTRKSVRVFQACFMRDQQERTLRWLEEGMRVEAASDVNRKTMTLAMGDWHLLPYDCRKPVEVGDLDGDGLVDQLHVAKFPQDLGVVCTADDVFVVRGLPANSNDVSAVDIDGDGLFEIRVGGSTASEYFVEYNRFDNGELRPIGGLVIGRNSSAVCADIDGDGLREILQGSVDVQENSWTIVTYQMRNFRYFEVEERTAQLLAKPDPARPESASESQLRELRQELELLAGGTVDQSTCL